MAHDGQSLQDGITQEWSTITEQAQILYDDMKDWDILQVDPSYLPDLIRGLAITMAFHDAIESQITELAGQVEQAERALS